MLAKLSWKFYIKSSLSTDRWIEYVMSLIFPVFRNFILVGSLFSGSRCNSEYTASNKQFIVYNELKEMWKEAVMIQFKAISRCFPEETYEINLRFQSDGRCQSRFGKGNSQIRQEAGTLFYCSLTPLQISNWTYWLLRVIYVETYTHKRLFVSFARRFAEL